MIKHIVMWKITDQYNEIPKAELLIMMKEKLEALPAQIAEIQLFKVDINMITSPAHFDISLTSTFQTLEDLQTYQVHPKHVEIVQFVQSIVTDRAVIDAEI